MRFIVPVAAWALSLGLVATPRAAQRNPQRTAPHPDTLFQTSHDCIACHNGLTTASGEDVSIGSAWRASMMANSARDPYWQASVRRETIDHPGAADDIADECTICHMPMARARGKAGGRKPGAVETDRLAADGVSCTLCHQIGSDRLGTPESFTGGFALAFPTRGEPRTMFGPFQVDTGRTTVMRSATGVKPAEALHVQQAELCATCHTLYTKALGAGGQVLGSLPEQVPYLEWRHSAFSAERSCQACHMPAVDHPTPIASVLGEPRDGLSRHTFLGGNFFMLRMLDRYRTDLRVEAPAAELDGSARGTIRQLQSDTASIAIPSTDAVGGRLRVDVGVSNLTGHKLPTGYPSRRAWLHLTVRDRAGRTIFESGALDASGAIHGNDQDVDGSRVEPHYTQITAADQVQIYESVMADASGAPTTGLLSATGFVKDNRLLPRGFDKASASADIAVRGSAAADDDFAGGGDRIRYVVNIGNASGPFDVDVELRYQPVAFRWAQNLRSYGALPRTGTPTRTDRALGTSLPARSNFFQRGALAPRSAPSQARRARLAIQSDATRRFVSFYDAMAGESSLVLAHASAHVAVNTQ